MASVFGADFVRELLTRPRRKHRLIPDGTVVDQDTLIWMEQYHWWLKRSKNDCHQGYVQGYLGGKLVALHRLVINAGIGEEVDHINGDALDNRRCNLRLVKHAENMQNRTRLNRNNTSGRRGIIWDKESRKWRARGRMGGKVFHLGRFDTIESADVAMREWRKQNMPFSEELV